MQYWLVTHWPHLVEESADELPSGIWIQKKAMDVGVNVEAGDFVAIYQSQSGPAQIRRRTPGGKATICHRHPGRGGIAVLCEALEPVIERPEIPIEEFAGGRKYRWNWHAKTKLISASGSVSRVELNKILGYKQGYNFHGYNYGRGIAKLTEAQFNSIRKTFLDNCPHERRIRTSKDTSKGRFSTHQEGGEGEDHLRLKTFVKEFPQLVFGGKIWKGAEVEFPFPGTGDRADVFLVDENQRPVLVEIELQVDDSRHPGILQAAKYKHMYAIVCNRTFDEVRGVLVAHSISNRSKEVCKRYGIETFEVDKTTIDHTRA